MSKKNLIAESTVRQWGKLAKIAPLTESFIEERSEQFTEGEELDENEDTLEEDNFDKSGPGPHREGAGKDGEQKGIASNQGKEPKDSPDGKLEIPGTGYAGDHKNTSKGPQKGSTDGGQQLQGKGNVTEGLDSLEDEEEDDMMGEPAGDAGPGGMDDMPPAPPMGDEMGGPEMGGDVDLEGLVAAIAQAITTSTGVEVSVAGGAEPMGDEMGGELPPPPMGDEPAMGGGLPADMPMDDDPGLGGEEEEEVVENQYNLSEVDDASFQQEANRRGYAMQEGADVQEEAAEVQQEDLVESIAKKVAARLSKKSAKRVQRPRKRRVAKK